MNRQTKGGLSTKNRHGMEYCPTCHQLRPTGYYRGIGARGGKAQSRMHTSEDYRRWGKMGGRGRKKQLLGLEVTP